MDIKSVISISLCAMLAIGCGGGESVATPGTVGTPSTVDDAGTPSAIAVASNAATASLIASTASAQSSQATPASSPSSASPAVASTSPASNPLLARTVRILALGDSMTAGNESAVDGFRSYRGRLHGLLTRAGYAVDFVGTQRSTPAVGGDPDHDGYGGAFIGPGGSSHNLWDRVSSIIAATSPDVVVLALGWNSAYNEPSVAGGKYRGLVERVRALRPQAHVVVATLSPQRGQTESQTAADVEGFASINANARALAAEYAGVGTVHLADFAGAGFQAGDYVDVIHWTQSGADRAAERLYAAIVAGPLRRF